MFTMFGTQLFGITLCFHSVIVYTPLWYFMCPFSIAHLTGLQTLHLLPGRWLSIHALPLELDALTGPL